MRDDTSQNRSEEDLPPVEQAAGDERSRQDGGSARRPGPAAPQGHDGIDGLTGVMGRQAYLEAEALMNRRIAEGCQPPFSIAILDINDLKKVNDASGREAGDRLIHEACRIVCGIFSHSSVYRVGGDEFAVISQGEDYRNSEELVERVRSHNEEAARTGGIVIACGLSKFDNDESVVEVLKRADQNMYDDKGALKSAGAGKPKRRYEYPPEKRSALEGLRQPFAVYQLIENRAVTLLLSDGFCDLFGYADRDEAVRDMDNDMYKDVHPDDIARIFNAEARFSAGDGKYDIVYRTRRKGAPGYRLVHALGEHVHADDGTRLAHVWYTDEGPCEESVPAAEPEEDGALAGSLRAQSILSLGRYDHLTGLPNASIFFERARAGKDTILEEGAQPAMLYFNLGGMKFFNTKYGYAQGDRILRLFAWLLSRAFGNELCCRIGADNFAAVAKMEGLEDSLNVIFRDFDELYSGKTPPIHVGVYPYRFEKVQGAVACDRAKFACSMLKGSYSSCINYYDSELRDEAILRQYIVENLDTAMREGWIQVYLQPIIRAVNERACDVEALARWVDPERGILPPDDFIPALEEAGLIHKLDLYMIESVLESIKVQVADGFQVIPHSINLSRADFDACDIVEEIRRRVDEAGIARDRITIEITESVIGSDLEFMKEQVERFQSLGFPVWMDDFGSGYSSLDALQSIKFDVIKFDMSFMRKLDEGEAGKIILTELMRMATSLGLGTVCEGVETESQVRFLQEIGCSKLQGYYFSKPISFEEVRREYWSGTLIPNENPDESEYYESMGRINLYDLGVIAQGDEKGIQNAFDTLPMGIIEIKGDTTRFVRSNQSYRDFIKRFFGFELSRLGTGFVKYDAPFLKNIVRTCRDLGIRSFYDERMGDGSIAHSFTRLIGRNPVAGSMAVAVAILSITEPDEATSYADIARALAADYYNLYVVDLDTDGYIEYSSLAGGEELSLERHGDDFFESAKRDTMTRIHENDRDQFLARFTKENIIRELDAMGAFTATYRLIDTGSPVYVNMKVSRLKDSNRIILGISDVDAQVRQRQEDLRLRQERDALGRIAALSGSFIVLYTVDPETDRYVQYNPSSEFEKFGLAREGDDFFADVKLDAPKAIHPDDMERHLRVLTKENMTRDIRENGCFVHSYRLLMDGRTVPVTLRAAMVEEDDGEKIILGVSKA